MHQIQQGSASKSPWVYEGLFEWQAYSSFAPLHGSHLPEASRSHCLLRLHVDVPGKWAVVLASELESNRKNIGLALGYESLARTVAEHFAEPLSRVTEVTWLAHFGDFSVARSYSELIGREDFCAVHLPWPLPSYRLSGYDWKSLGADELRYGWLKGIGPSFEALEPVAAVLVRCTS